MCVFIPAESCHLKLEIQFLLVIIFSSNAFKWWNIFSSVAHNIQLLLWQRVVRALHRVALMLNKQQIGWVLEFTEPLWGKIPKVPHFLEYTRFWYKMKGKDGRLMTKALFFFYQTAHPSLKERSTFVHGHCHENSPETDGTVLRRLRWGLKWPRLSRWHHRLMTQAPALSVGPIWNGAMADESNQDEKKNHFEKKYLINYTQRYSKNYVDWQKLKN